MENIFKKENSEGESPEKALEQLKYDLNSTNSDSDLDDDDDSRDAALAIEESMMKDEPMECESNYNVHVSFTDDDIKEEPCDPSENIILPDMSPNFESSNKTSGESPGTAAAAAAAKKEIKSKKELEEEEREKMQTNCTNPIMESDEMRRRFTENLEKIIKSKREDNKAFLNENEYTKRIGDVIEAKNVLKTPGSKRSMRHYRLVQKYDVITKNGTTRLIKPDTVLNETTKSKVYYVTNGELFDIIHNTHLAIGHGGRNRLASEISKRYCNITKETIMIYLQLCAHCQKKRGTPKTKKLVPQPISHFNTRARAQLDLIDMQSQSYNNYGFIMVYQDHLTKFVQLKALKSKRAEEVANHLLEIFTTFGAPLILHSDNGLRELANSVLLELHTMWPEVKIVHEKLSDSQSQGSIERADIESIEKILGTWMDENKSKDWPAGIKFVQFKKNCSLHSGIGKSPYEAMFGCPASLQNVVTHLATEDDFESIVKEIEGESKDDEHREIEENNLALENDEFKLKKC